MVENKRFGEKVFRGLPITDVPRIKDLVARYRENPDFTMESFFSFALLGYYDAMHGGMDATAGHILYRLSDFIEAEERKKIAVYPSQTGSIINNHEGEVDEEFFEGEEKDRWDSLEDWRKLWKGQNRFIPEYQKQLPSGDSYGNEVRTTGKEGLHPTQADNVVATINGLFPQPSKNDSHTSPKSKEEYWAQKKAKKGKGKK